MPMSSILADSPGIFEASVKPSVQSWYNQKSQIIVNFVS